jgi:hypothetical protein
MTQETYAPETQGADLANHESRMMMRGEPSRRSEGGRKAAETRKRNREEAKEPVNPIQAAGLSLEQAKETKLRVQRLFEKREEFAAIEQELKDMEIDWDAWIDSLIP